MRAEYERVLERKIEEAHNVTLKERDLESRLENIKKTELF
jgi:hypothetical protein